MSTPTSEGRTRTGVKSRWWVLPTLAVLSAVPSVLLSTQWLRIPQAHTSSSSDLHRFLAPSAGLAHGHLTFGRAGSAINRNRQVMMVTANQPLPCQTRRGDWIMALALRNKLMYSTLHGYKTWWSTELVSAWDLEAAWNKIPLLYVLASPESPVTHGIEWLLWMDDDAIFTLSPPLKKFAELDGQIKRIVAEAEAKVNSAQSKVEALVVANELKASASEQLVQALLTALQALQTRVVDLESQPRNAGSGGSRLPTLEELVERRSQLRKIKEAGLSCGEVRAAGYTCADAKAVGFSLLDAKAAGWSTDELRTAGYINQKGMSSREFFDKYQAGCRNFAGLDLSGEDFGGMVIDQACNMSRCKLVEVSFDHAVVVGLDMSSCDLSGADLSRASVKNCNVSGATLSGANLSGAQVSGGTFEGSDLSHADLSGATVQGCKAVGVNLSGADLSGTTLCGVDFTSTQMSGVNLSHASLRDCDLTNAQLPAKAQWSGATIGGQMGTAPMKALGFTCAEVKAMGMVEGLKAAGYTCAEAKQAGYSCAEAKQAGYTSRECKQGGYSYQEARSAGYNYSEQFWGSGTTW